MTEAQRRTALAAVVRKASRAGYLARASLLVARGEYPRLDPTVSLAEIDRLSARVREAMAEGITPPWRALADVLGRSEGFFGAVEDYDNPENSYLNRVLARRHGLPILLSIVWVEVARGAGIPARGIGLPGHFIAAVGPREEATFVDPFGGGRVLTRRDAVKLAQRAIADPELVPDAGWLRPCTPRALVMRMLGNLVSAYESRGDEKRLVRVLSDQIALAPEEPCLVARRGEALARAGDVEGGLRDLNTALGRLPVGAAFDHVHECARVLARLREWHN